MNKLILFVCIFYTVSVKSQLKYIGSNGIPHNLEFHDVSGRPLPINDHSNIEGSPLLQGKWTFGILMLENGGTFSDSLINYSLYDDKLFVKKNEKIYPINYRVKEFFLEDSEDPNEKRTYHFQNGFPEINKNDSLTFYKILYRGNSIELLKWEHKKVKEIYNYGGPFQSMYSTVHEFFVFFPKQNKIVELGFTINLNMLRKKLPEYSEQINAYNTSHKLNGKKDDDLIELFSFLNSTN